MHRDSERPLTTEQQTLTNGVNARGVWSSSYDLYLYYMKGRTHSWDGVFFFVFFLFFTVCKKINSRAA